jgi:hypothetical protein
VADEKTAHDRSRQRRLRLTRHRDLGLSPYQEQDHGQGRQGVDSAIDKKHMTIGAPSASPAWIAADRADRTSRPTRMLCGAVYVDGELRDEVREMFVHRPHQAWAPCYSVDLVALLRHTARARRLFLVRDLMLVGLLVGTSGAVSYVAFGFRLMGFAAVLLTALGIGALRGILHRRKITVRGLIQRLIRRIRRRGRRAIKRTLLATLLSLVVLVALLADPVVRLCVLFVLSGLVMAELVVLIFSAVAYVCASKTAHNRAAVLRDLILGVAGPVRICGCVDHGEGRPPA